jgi:hypothetical protein
MPPVETPTPEEAEADVAADTKVGTPVPQADIERFPLAPPSKAIPLT